MCVCVCVTHVLEKPCFQCVCVCCVSVCVCCVSVCVCVCVCVEVDFGLHVTRAHSGPYGTLLVSETAEHAVSSKEGNKFPYPPGVGVLVVGRSPSNSGRYWTSERTQGVFWNLAEEA